MSSIESLVKFYIFCIAVLFGFTLHSIRVHQKRGRKQNIISLKADCIVPARPSNGWWIVWYESAEAILGTNVPGGTALHIHCNESYKLHGYNTSICLDGNWFPELGRCLKTCPAMFSTPLMKVRCSYDDKIMSCEDAIDNTQAQFTCAPFYEDERSMRIKAMCRNGTWSEGVPQCVPVCGRRKTKKAMPLIINGTATEKGEFPWQVAIYRKGQNICGGTLLHERLILTAAHCLSNENGIPRATDQYRVIAGNYHRVFKEASREEGAQISAIHAIFISEDYVGADRMYSGDIAFVIPNKTFHLSGTVQPICIDWTNEYENNLFRLEKPMGIVSGWGHTIEYYKSSTVLRRLEVPIIEREKCTQMLSQIDYQDYITQDKICAGYINQSKSVCHGDSGSGLIFNNNGRYYIIGIVSIALKGRSENGGCDSQNLALYTHVSKYLDDLIWKYYVRYKPFRFPLVETAVTASSRVPTVAAVTVPKKFKKPTVFLTRGCILPENPQFGQWSLYGTANYHRSKLSAGTMIESGTILKIKCQKGFKLDGDKMVACENSTWSSAIGECLQICPSIYSTKNMNVTCFHKMGKLRNCVDPLNGTNAKYQCVSFYENMKIMEHPVYCLNGTWSPGEPQCVPKCGRKSLPDPLYQESSPRADFPWMVAIYRKIDELICTGSLLTEKIVLVNSRCLEEYNNNFIVVSGKFFRRLNDSRDLEKMQTSKIRDVVMHQGQHTGGPALIILEKPFRFSQAVQPVCVDWDGEFQKDGREGFVSGWGYSVQESEPVANDVLTTVEVVLVSLDECRINLAEEFANGTDEKLCVRRKTNGSVSCFGEEGGGLFVKHTNKYYIFGIMDVSNSKKACLDRREYSLYIPIHKYMDTFAATVSSRDLYNSN